MAPTPAESYPTKAEALDAALAEVRRAVLAKVNVCVRLIGGKGRINVTEILRDRIADLEDATFEDEPPNAAFISRPN